MPLSTRRGFTLIETLASLFLISVMVAFVAIVIGTTQTTRDAAYENMAFHIASAKLDELRAGGYDALPASGAFVTPELSALPQGLASTTVTTWNAGTKQVVTGVSWLGNSGLTRVISLTTLITQTGGL